MQTCSFRASLLIPALQFVTLQPLLEIGHLLFELGTVELCHCL